MLIGPQLLSEKSRMSLFHKRLQFLAESTLSEVKTLYSVLAWIPRVFELRVV